MALLNRDAIAQNNKLPTVDVDCPELGGAVRLRALRGRDKEALTMELAKREDGDVGYMARLVARCAVDEDGALLFDSPDPAGELNAVTLQRLFVEAQKLNKMGRFEEDAVKNSEADPSGASSSGSP